MSCIVFGRDVPRNKRAIIADASHRYIAPGHNALWLRAFNKWYITASGDELIAEIYVDDNLWGDIKKWGGEMSHTQDGDIFISYPPKAFDGILSYINIIEIYDPNQIKRERHVREKELDKLGKTDVEAYLKRLNDERREMYRLMPLTREEFNERVEGFINPDGSIRMAGYLFDKIIYKEHLDQGKSMWLFKNKAMQLKGGIEMINLERIRQSIREAIKENPIRQYHGYKKYTTAKTAFLIDEKTFKISNWAWPTSPAITVHSHQDNFQTLNSEDVKIWRDFVKRGLSTINIVIFPESNSTMDILAIEREEKNRNKLISFLKLLPKKIDEELGFYLPNEERHAGYDRILLRKFAKKYGLVFLENVSYDNYWTTAYSIRDGKKILHDGIHETKGPGNTIPNIIINDLKQFLDMKYGPGKKVSYNISLFNGERLLGNPRPPWFGDFITGGEPIPKVLSIPLGLPTEPTGKLTRKKITQNKTSPLWKYEDYSEWSRQIAKNYTRKEIEKELGIARQQTGKLAESHLAAIKRTSSMQSQSQRRAQTGNVVRANYERKQAYKNALEIYNYYPEKTKEGIKENKIKKNLESKRLEIILNITPVAEDKEYFCSENSLATVLRYFNPGLTITPSRLHGLGCDSFPHIKKCFSMVMNLHYKLVNNTTIAQVRASLRRNYPVIASIIPNTNVKWGNGKERHTVVINGINLKNDLSIIDNGHIKFQAFRAFVQEWNRTEREAYIWSKHV